MAVYGEDEEVYVTEDDGIPTTSSIEQVFNRFSFGVIIRAVSISPFMSVIGRVKWKGKFILSLRDSGIILWERRFPS